MGDSYRDIAATVKYKAKNENFKVDNQGNQKQAIKVNVKYSGPYVYLNRKGTGKYDENFNNKKSQIQRALTTAFFQFIDGYKSVPSIMDDSVETYEGESLDKIDPTKIKEQIEQEEDPNRKQELTDLLNVYRLLEANQYQTDFQSLKKVLRNKEIYLTDPSSYFNGEEILDYFHNQPSINKYALKLYRNIKYFNLVDRKLGNVCLRKGSNEGEKVELVDIDFDIFAYDGKTECNPLFDDNYKHNEKLLETLENIYEPTQDIIDKNNRKKIKNKQTMNNEQTVAIHNIKNMLQNEYIKENAIYDIIIEPIKKIGTIIYAKTFDERNLKNFIDLAISNLILVGVTDKNEIKKEIKIFFDKMSDNFKKKIVKDENLLKNLPLDTSKTKKTDEINEIIDEKVKNSCFENCYSFDRKNIATDLNKDWELDIQNRPQIFRLTRYGEDEIIERIKKTQEEYTEAFKEQKIDNNIDFTLKNKNEINNKINDNFNKSNNNFNDNEKKDNNENNISSDNGDMCNAVANFCKNSLCCCLYQNQND